MSTTQPTAVANQRVEATRKPGIYRVHERKCDGGRCRCVPSYQAAVYVAAQGKRLRKHFPSIREAEAWRAEALGAVHSGQLRAVRPRTLREAADELVAGMADGTLLNRSRRPYKPATVRSYRRALTLRVLPELGHLRLADVRPGHLQRFAEALIRDGLDASTVRNTVDPVRVIFRRAVRLGELNVDPTTNLDLPAARGRRHVCVGPADALALVDALPEAERALWALALFGGLRRGELRGLRWSDVDLAVQPATVTVTRTWDDDEGEVAVKTDAGERVVAIPELVSGLLAAHGLATGRDGDAFVFGTTATRPFTPSTVRRRALRAWQAAELPYLTTHEARHAAASFLISRPDVSPLELTRTIGHSDQRTTMNIYGHLLPDSGRRVAASLDAMIEAARAG
jgi:integrase